LLLAVEVVQETVAQVVVLVVYFNHHVFQFQEQVLMQLQLELVVQQDVVMVVLELTQQVFV
tara:strand:- start:410 stop:592 length:183 start_codon:yes stop_codon:yes gene_type:complete